MNTLLFGATGTLGKSISTLLSELGHNVQRVSRNANKDAEISLDDSFWLDQLSSESNQFSVVFAQGTNINDNIFDSNGLRSMLESNLLFIVDKISQLLSRNLLRDRSKIVIVSSVWQDFSRPNKLSYSVSKSSIRGLINSLVADLSPKGIRVNAVLPGVIDSPMTRSALTEEGFNRILAETPTNFLATELDVARAVAWLLSEESTGVTGQFIRVDNGWSNVRLFP